MAIDGVFLHFYLEELSFELNNAKINKIYQPNSKEIIINFRNNFKNNQLLISVNLDSPHLYLTSEKFSNPDQPLFFGMLLRKYIGSGQIKAIKQKDNDRIIIFDISSFNELGDEKNYHLIFEIMGRNTNLILSDDNFIIIDCLRKLSLSHEDARIILPKAKYEFPQKQGTINPFTMDLSDEEKMLNIDQLEGCSPFLKRAFRLNDSVDQVLRKKIKPNLFFINKRVHFYLFDFAHILEEKEFYPSISSLLEEVFKNIRQTNNSDIQVLFKRIKRSIRHEQTKLSHLQDDLISAHNKISLKEHALVLQANLYQVKMGDAFLAAFNYHNNSMIQIKLDPKKTPSENLQDYFTKIKKAEKALPHLKREMKKCNFEIDYLEGLIVQLENATNDQILEIKDEMQNEDYIKSKKKTKRPPAKFDSYQVEDAIIMVGKNNLQNNHLTHKWANKNDYWFHVKNAPSAHIILRTNNITEKQIRICAMLASLNSKLKNSSSVPVDYTLIKYIRKIPGQKGSFVNYSNQKTIYIDPDLNTLKKLLDS